MIRQVIAALLAAASWAPAAQAQDTAPAEAGERRAWRAEHVDRGQAYGQARPQFQRAEERAPEQVQAQAQAQAPAAGGWQGRGNWGGRRVEAQVAPSVQQRPDDQAQVGWQNRGEQSRGDWRQRGGDQPRYDAQAQAQAQAQAEAQAQARSGWQNRGVYDRGERGGYRGGIFSGQPAQGDWRRDANRTSPYFDDQGRRYEDRRYGGGYEQRGVYGDRYAQRGAWNRGWRNDRQYDWNGFRQSNRYAFHLPRYYAPSNWTYGYRRFSIGVTVSSLLWGQNYWIEQPDYYRLPDAYGPYRWVRYYNDTLLVDIRTGQVVDTVYDIFW